MIGSNKVTLPAAAAIVALFLGCGGDKQKQQTTPGGAVGESRQAQPVAGSGQAGPAGQQQMPPAGAAPVDAPTGGGNVGVSPATGEGPAPVREVKAAEAAVRARRYERAIGQARRALRKSEKYVPAMVVMARAYYGLGKLEFTEAVCDIALKLKPNTGPCYHLIGLVALKQENESRALKNFEKSTQVQPGFAPAWLNFGAMLLRIKAYERAAGALERAAEYLPNRPEVQLNLGSAYRGSRKPGQARQAYIKAMKLRPRYPQAYFNMGILYLDATSTFDGKNRMQQLAEAQAWLTRYKNSSAYGGKDDPVDEYIEQAQKQQKREQKRLEREARKRAREAAKAAQGKK
jgi:tetratricopeptide (TPR) repeat protein